MKDYCIVLNPQARGARQLEVLHFIADVARDAEIRVTTAPGEAESFAREAAAEGFGAVIAAGGDGTVNEVLRGLAGTYARLGVLPLGTMNVFARELGLPIRFIGVGEAIEDLRPFDATEFVDALFDSGPG
jgi:diacylglycerol kinase family enzyme